MELSHSTSMRMEQRQLLTPRMIQSMEILQLPLMALEERIEQELESNPVLELKEPDFDVPPIETDSPPTSREENRSLIVDADSPQAEDFARLERMEKYLENEEFSPDDGFHKSRRARDDGDPDKKFEALANTAGRVIGLSEYLLGQWTFVEAPEPIKTAGRAIIDHLADDGYLRTSFESIRDTAKPPVTLADLAQALPLVQTLEPTGVAARNLAECWLIQLEAMSADPESARGHDLDLERTLVRNHMEDLRLNRYPAISLKLARPIDQIKAAVQRLGMLWAHPGRSIGGKDAAPVFPDALIRLDEATGKYVIEMVRERVPELSVSEQYRRMSRDKGVDRKTRDYLSNHVRNAKWLMDAIDQREGTIKRVIRVVVDAQQEFFEKGPEYLKPLPMTQVAEMLGFHVATVSRAVSEKWIQTPRGVFPLRRFFSQGTTSADGQDMSWDAVKEKLRQLVDAEDKTNPLNDEQIQELMMEQGIKLARRTVAKYRGILDLPVARQRKQF